MGKILLRLALWLSLRGQHCPQALRALYSLWDGVQAAAAQTWLSRNKELAQGLSHQQPLWHSWGHLFSFFAPRCYCNCTYLFLFFLDNLARCSPNKPWSLSWQGRGVLILTQSQSGCSGDNVKSLGGFCATGCVEHPNKHGYYLCLGFLFILTPCLPSGHPLLQPGPFERSLCPSGAAG